MQTGGFASTNRGVQDEALQAGALLKAVPPPLQEAVASLGGKPNPSDLRKVIVLLSELRWWTPKELAAVLRRKDVSNLSERHLSPLVKDGILDRRYPDNPAHPQQSYRARQSALVQSDDDEGRGD